MPRQNKQELQAQNEKIAASLKVLHDLQNKDGSTVFQSSQFSRVHRDRLLKHGFLTEVIRGWLILSNPNALRGDSTTWYASFWTFVRSYLGKRFDGDYCLSSEASILRHTGAMRIPKQVTVITKKMSGQVVNLPHGTTLLLYTDINNFPEQHVQIDGIWCMELEEALCRVSPSYFEEYPMDAEIALRSLKNPSGLLRYLLEGKHSAIAGRLVGAYTFLGETQIAHTIEASMTAADYPPRIVNPFSTPKPTLGKGFRFVSPYCARIESLWGQMREDIIPLFPVNSGFVKDPEEYLQRVEDGYVNDAYNSLSIEGYRVTPDLIEKIQNGNWNPDQDSADVAQKDAMAAKGYHVAFQAVKLSIGTILRGETAGDVVSRDHSQWYLEMFSPMVQAGLLQRYQLSGYRNHPN